jgi:peroxiredoxin (alkyl hydroperoxide reductase subunit C)
MNKNYDEYQGIEIGESAPNFKAKSFVKGEIKEISLSDYKGKWVVLFFYPSDFTFICPTELSEMADKYEEFQKLNAEILSISTDTVFTHKAWHNASETIRKIKFPMVADTSHEISWKYNTLIENEGISLRGTFIIDPEGILQVCEINNNSIGRSIDEIMRKLQAAKFVAENGGEVCPVNWKPGSKTLKPGLDLVGKI